jgi:hypothetical protein
MQAAHASPVTEDVELIAMEVAEVRGVEAVAARGARARRAFVLAAERDPISACFKTGTICSTEERFCCTAHCRPPAGASVPGRPTLTPVRSGVAQRVPVARVDVCRNAGAER